MTPDFNISASLFRDKVSTGFRLALGAKADK